MFIYYIQDTAARFAHADIITLNVKIKIELQFFRYFYKNRLNKT